MRRRTAQDLAVAHAAALITGDDARIDRASDGRHRDRQIDGVLHRPLAGALHARAVHHLIDEEAEATAILGIAGAEDAGRDLDEEGLQLAFVPAGKDFGQLFIAKTADAAQQVIGLGNELHIAVLDAVVHHLDVVAGAAGADVRHAGAGIADAGTVDLGGDLLTTGSSRS